MSILAIGVFCLNSRAITAQAPNVDLPAHPVDAMMQDSHAKKQTRQIRLTMKASTIGSILLALGKEVGQPVFFDDKDPRFARRIDVQIADSNVQNAFASVLKGTGLGIALGPDGRTIVVSAVKGKTKSIDSKAIGRVIGQVVDSASKQGVVGAMITIAGTSLRAVTNEHGRFLLAGVPAGEQLLSVRLFGYKAVERVVIISDSGQVVVNIVLVPMATALSGVVTTATGLQRRMEVGNDITVLNVDSVLRVAPINSLTDLLESRVPGLTVQRSSGAPGDPSRIRLRGAGSITGNNDPILIVDGIRVYAAQSDARNTNLANEGNSGAVITGVTTLKQKNFAAPSPLDQIDPNSIETIEVYKGPSAAAMYGSDAANGVIVITRKRGRAGPAHWSAVLNQGISYTPGQWPANYYRFGISGTRFMPGSNIPFCEWDDPSCQLDSIVSFQALNDPRYTVFGHGSTQDASATVGGGSSALTYSLTGTASTGIGILTLPGIEVKRYKKFYSSAPPHWMKRPDNYKTWGASGVLASTPNPAISLSISASLFNSNQQRSSLADAITQLQGRYIDPGELAILPLVTGFVQRATAGSLSYTSGATVNWQAAHWLPLSMTLGLNTIQRADETLIPYGINSGAQGSQGADTTGRYGLGKGTTQTKTLNIGANRIELLNGFVNLASGINVHRDEYADVVIETTELSPGVTRPNSFVQSLTQTSQRGATATTYGWYFSPTFQVRDRLFFSPGIRFDGGSTSGSNTGYTPFPKMDLSYIAVQRDHPFGMLTELRPRIAFGRAGTQPQLADALRMFNSFTTLATTPVVSLDGVTFVPSVMLSSLGNTLLRPERSTELEGGFDAEFWNGRLSIGYSQYRKIRNDAIIRIDLAPSVVPSFATPSVLQNIGVVRNTGTELSLTAILLQSRSLSWNVNGNISRNKNIVVRLNRDQEVINLGHGTWVVAGYPLDGRWARPIVSFADVNNNGIIDAPALGQSQPEIRLGDSLEYMGQQAPKYTMDFNTGIRAFDGRLGINASFSYVNGVTQYNEGGQTSGAFALLANAPNTSLAMQAAVQAAKGMNEYDNNIISKNSSISGVVQTVNTLRFQSLTMSYNVPRTVSSYLRVPVMSVSLQGRNLGLHSNYRGKDPNVNAFSSGASDRITDAGGLPQPRIWGIRINLGNNI